MSDLDVIVNAAVKTVAEVVAFDHDAPPGIPHGPLCAAARQKPCLGAVQARSTGWRVGDVPVAAPDDIGRLEALRIAQGRAEMGLVNLARDMIANALISGGSYNLFTNANAALGVGNSSAAFDAAQVDLQGGSKTRKAMEASYPSRSTNVVSWRSVFGTGDANYAWEEFAVFNATVGAQMLLREVSSMGTKTASFAWQLTATSTFVLV